MTPKVHRQLHGIIFARNCHSIGLYAIRYYIIDDSSELIIESHAVAYNNVLCIIGDPCSLQTTHGSTSSTSNRAMTPPQSSDLAQNQYNNTAPYYVSGVNVLFITCNI